MPDIYAYTDYRKFLRDFYEESKAVSTAFSFQSFARKAQISSSGFLLHVMKGERNLTRPVMLNVAKAMQLSTDQTDYFENLVLFAQAKNIHEKERAYAKIISSRQSMKIQALDDTRYEFYSRWYHSVIREIAALPNKRASAAELAKLLVPAITTAEAKQSLSLLEDLAILQKTPGGTYEQSEPFLSGGSSDVRNMAIVQFQKEMLDLAAKAWEHFSQKEIDMHTITFSVSDDAIHAIRKATNDYKSNIMNIIHADKKEATRAYNINVNLFPVSKSIKENTI